MSRYDADAVLIGFGGIPCGSCAVSAIITNTGADRQYETPPADANGIPPTNS